MKTLFEQNRGTYTKVGDYYTPNLTAPESKPIGKYGMICRNYLKNHRPLFYKRLFISGKLFDYLADIDRQANALKDKLSPEYKEVYGVTEQLKADNQMEWVRLMNSIAYQIDKVILSDPIHMKD